MWVSLVALRLVGDSLGRAGCQFVGDRSGSTLARCVSVRNLVDTG